MKRSEETKLSKSIRDALELAGYKVFRVQSGIVRIGSRYIHMAPPGTPDICGYDPRDGKFIALEVKDQAEPTKEQIEFIRLASAAGCKAAFVHSIAEALAAVGFDNGGKAQQLLQGDGVRATGTKKVRHHGILRRQKHEGDCGGMGRGN